MIIYVYINGYIYVYAHIFTSRNCFFVKPDSAFGSARVGSRSHRVSQSNFFVEFPVVDSSSNHSIHIYHISICKYIYIYMYMYTIKRIILVLLESYQLYKHKKHTLLRVIPTMTFIHFLTGKSSGILSDISSGILSGILFGMSSGISSGILSGKSSGILSGKSSGILSGISSGILSDIRLWHIF